MDRAMSLSPISSNIVNLLSEEPVKSTTRLLADSGLLAADGVLTANGSFSDIFTEAFKNVAETDVADKLSAVELLTGQTDDMSGLLLDAQKAEIALNLALQLRNKALDAYNEIMRMQV